MSITRIFKNLYDEVISSQQATNLDNFNEEIYEGGELKKVLHYDESRQPFSMSYYLEPTDDKMTFIQQASNDYGGAGVYFDKQSVNGFTLWSCEFYEGLELGSKGKVVFDSLGRKVAYQQINIDTQAIISTYKYCYLENVGEFETHPKIPFHRRFDFLYRPQHITVDLNLSFYMDMGGGAFYIDEDDNIFLEDSRLAAIFNWNDHPYYHTAEPLLPTAPNI